MVADHSTMLDVEIQAPSLVQAPEDGAESLWLQAPLNKAAHPHVYRTCTPYLPTADGQYPHGRHRHTGPCAAMFLPHANPMALIDRPVKKKLLRYR